MIGMLLHHPRPIEEKPLKLEELPIPIPRRKQILLRVRACGICRTDLHIVEGEIPIPKLPIIPGHQVVGEVIELGEDSNRFKKGERVGVPWLNYACGDCPFCRKGKENLCDNAKFTGYHTDGGYAQYIVVHQDFAYHLPDIFSDIQVAPLLCAGAIGFRALRLTEIESGERLGLFGFGASAHIVLQIARYKGCEVYVFTRGKEHQELAEDLGAVWTGRPTDIPPAKLDASIIFAPAGELVLNALKVLKKGGRLTLAGIYSTPIPEIEYRLIYEERQIKSVANSTRQDVQELLSIASQIPIKTKVQTFPLEEANLALSLLKNGKIQGSGVLSIP